MKNLRSAVRPAAVRLMVQGSNDQNLYSRWMMEKHRTWKLHRISISGVRLNVGVFTVYVMYPTVVCWQSNSVAMTDRASRHRGIDGRTLGEGELAIRT